jgi:hypothetical protein
VNGEVFKMEGRWKRDDLSLFPFGVFTQVMRIICCSKQQKALLVSYSTTIPSLSI